MKIIVTLGSFPCKNRSFIIFLLKCPFPTKVSTANVQCSSVVFKWFASWGMLEDETLHYRLWKDIFFLNNSLGYAFSLPRIWQWGRCFIGDEEHITSFISAAVFELISERQRKGRSGGTLTVVQKKPDCFFRLSNLLRALMCWWGQWEDSLCLQKSPSQYVPPSPGIT